ncbi:MAG: hypothetical protein HY841_15260 [Bacteroidetes bacterium]|nr:hypothetical protein [Bacteroidota bacterium]
MAKFIELDHYDIMANRPGGKRTINVDQIRELTGPYTSGNISVIRVHLWDKDFIDVRETLHVVKDKIETCR